MAGMDPLDLRVDPGLITEITAGGQRLQSALETVASTRSEKFTNKQALVALGIVAGFLLGVCGIAAWAASTIFKAFS